MTAPTYLTVIGKVGRVPEAQETKVGKLAVFSVGVNNWDGTVTWYRISVWPDKGADVAMNLKVGETVAVTGKYRTSEWQGTVKHEISASNWLAIEWPFAFGKGKDEVPF